MAGNVPKRARSLSTRQTTAALLLRSVPYGESDVIATLFCEEFGKITATAYGVRNPRRSQGNTLEPIHTLQVTLDHSSASDRYTLRTSKLLTIRSVLCSRLPHLDAAGRALRWVRLATPTASKEPQIWSELTLFLDLLNAEIPSAHTLLVCTGLRLLDALGYTLELSQCVKCAKVCDPDQSALFDPVAGGLVCRLCGGGPIYLSTKQRQSLRACVQFDPSAQPIVWPVIDDVEQALECIEATLKAHASVESM